MNHLSLQKEIVGWEFRFIPCWYGLLILFFCWASTFSEWSFTLLLYNLWQTSKMFGVFFNSKCYVGLGFGAFFLNFLQLITLTDSVMVFNFIYCGYSSSENCWRCCNILKRMSCHFLYISFPLLHAYLIFQNLEFPGNPLENPISHTLSFAAIFKHHFRFQ